MRPYSLHLALLATTWLACVPSPETSTTTTTSSTTGTGGSTTSTTPTTGTGGSATGGTGGSTTGGTGGGTGGSPAVGQNASETVAGGQVAKNSQYRMIFTLGQPAPQQGTATNSSYRLQGGLVGKTETK